MTYLTRASLGKATFSVICRVFKDVITEIRAYCFKFMLCKQTKSEQTNTDNLKEKVPHCYKLLLASKGNSSVIMLG